MGNCCISTTLDSCTTENTPEFTFKNQIFEAKVLDVYDGDTITVALKIGSTYYKHKVRLYGLDTAEIKTRNQEEKKVGLEAKEFLSNMVLNKLIEIRTPEREEDKYGRILGSVYYTGKNVSDIMIENGYGYFYDGKKKKQFSEWYGK